MTARIPVVYVVQKLNHSFFEKSEEINSQLDDSNSLIKRAFNKEPIIINRMPIIIYFFMIFNLISFCIRRPIWKKHRFMQSTFINQKFGLILILNEIDKNVLCRDDCFTPTKVFSYIKNKMKESFKLKRLIFLILFGTMD